MMMVVTSGVDKLLDSAIGYTDRGLSSAGRAPALQAGCHRFDSDRLHQFYRPLQRRQPLRSKANRPSGCPLRSAMAREQEKSTSFEKDIGFRSARKGGRMNAT